MILPRPLPLMALLLPYGTMLAQADRPKSAATGLTGTYYAGANFERKAFTRVDPSLDFTWWQKPPGPGLDGENYSVRWLGRLFAPVTGRYRFSVEVDDGVRVWVGGRRLIDAWDLHDNVTFEGSIDLIANRYYDLRIDYFNAMLEGEIKLYWIIPDEKKTSLLTNPQRQLIGTEYLGREPIRLVVKPAKPVALSATPPPIGTRPTARAVAKPTVVTSKARQQTARPVPALPRAATPPVAETAAAPDRSVFGQLAVGERVVLQHVFFEQSDYRLLPASYAELDKLVRTLQQQPTLRLEIAGHTDNQGDPRLNLALSENRAKVVANYLMRHGIREDRLTPKGYGGSRPLTDNAGEAARAQNRRVEFIVR